jgi:predicted nucleic acid-binding protein
MLVISDTSPIRALHWIGELQLLAELFGAVAVPPAVADELKRPRLRYPAIDVMTLDFVQVVCPASAELVEELKENLAPGESEALALALEDASSILLVDDLPARHKAEEMGVTIVGTLGVLLRGKQAGLIPTLKPLIDRLRDELGFFLSDAIVRLVLSSAGE